MGSNPQHVVFAAKDQSVADGGSAEKHTHSGSTNSFSGLGMNYRTDNYAAVTKSSNASVTTHCVLKDQAIAKWAEDHGASTRSMSTT